MSKVLVKLFPTPEKQERPENRQEEVQGTFSSSSIILDDITKRPRRTSSDTRKRSQERRLELDLDLLQVE